MAAGDRQTRKAPAQQDLQQGPKNDKENVAENARDAALADAAKGLTLKDTEEPGATKKPRAPKKTKASTDTSIDDEPPAVKPVKAARGKEANKKQKSEMDKKQDQEVDQMQANPNAGKSRAVGAGHKKPAEEAADKAEEQTNSEAAESAGASHAGKPKIDDGVLDSEEESGEDQRVQHSPVKVVTAVRRRDVRKAAQK